MKQIIICYVATVGMLMGFAIAMANVWIPAMMLFLLAFALCLIWFAHIMSKREDRAWYKWRKCQRKISELEKKYDALKAMLDQLQDKPETAQSNVRPGSRPSIEYMNMVVERSEQNDLRSEDRSAQD